MLQPARTGFSGILWRIWIAWHQVWKIIIPSTLQGVEHCAHFLDTQCKTDIVMLTCHLPGPCSHLRSCCSCVLLLNPKMHKFANLSLLNFMKFMMALSPSFLLNSSSDLKQSDVPPPAICKCTGGLFWTITHITHVTHITHRDSLIHAVDSLVSESTLEKQYPKLVAC